MEKTSMKLCKYYVFASGSTKDEDNIWTKDEDNIWTKDEDNIWTDDPVEAKLCFNMMLMRHKGTGIRIFLHDHEARKDKNIETA